jgi:hypothetical protein
LGSPLIGLLCRAASQSGSCGRRCRKSARLLALRGPPCWPRFKAAVFASAGYQRNQWQHLQADLRDTALLEPAAETQTAFGQKFEVPAILRGARRELAVTVIWLIRRGEDFPRLVTAYPRSPA